MRPQLAFALLLVGCGDGQSGEEYETNGYVVPANGDPQNYTWSGFPRHRYAACGRYIELRKPFEVVPGSFNDPLAIPLSYLDDPATNERTPEGIDRQNRIEFGFPSRYRGEGMWEWHARGGAQRFVRPLSDAVRFLKSDQARHEQGAGGNSWFQGLMNGRRVAMTCTAVNWPNPSCDIEVAVGINNLRFMATLPPRAISKLDKVVETGAELFADAARSCQLDGSARSPEIKVIKPSVTTGRF